MNISPPKPMHGIVIFDDGQIAKHRLRQNASGGYIFGAPKLLSKRAIRQFGRMLSNLGSRSGENSASKAKKLLNRQILAANDDLIVWVRETERRVCWHRKEAIDAPQPRLVFVWQACRSLSVFAVKSTTLSENTPLYNAPYWNIDEDGTLCLGGAVLPKTFNVHYCEEAEECLFGAQFSHRNGSHKVVRGDDSDKGLLMFWRGVQTKQKFPNSELIAAKKRLGDIL
ncbi:hypothetical protein [Halioglobus sp. HI00S01]|uniref:hypothetical protein n=1 Tax=Halioglobus sp. HI00S01 TaxID=1822214 RepID=UPI0012E74C80|nr:hypothetical protein [Halioglobus sp. HI00S01]